MCRAELQEEIQETEELERAALLLGAERLCERHGRGGRGRGPAQELRQRLDLVAGLDRLDLLDIGRIEKLRPIEHEGKIGLAADHRLDALGLPALPGRAGEQIAAGAVTGGPTADIGEVEGIEVDELQRVVAPLLDCRHGEDERFGSQVGADIGIGRVGIRRLDRLVLGRIDPRIVDQRVPGRLVFRAAAVDEIGMLDAVAVDHGKAVDRRLPRDDAGLARRWCLSTGRKRGDAAAREQGCGTEHNLPPVQLRCRDPR